MESLNELTRATITQLSHQRTLHRDHQERASSLESVRVVDAHPKVSPSHRELASQRPAMRTSRLLPQLPASGVIPAPHHIPGVSCPRCQDRGYLRADVPFGHPQFGKPVECTCKQAKKQEAYRQRLREQSKLDELAVFQEETFDSFQFWLPGVGEAYEAAKQFAQKPHGWLVLAGNNGCGKTHLAVAIARACLQQEQVVLFAVVPDLLDHLRAAFKPTAEETFDEEFARMREAHVLLLDDLGAESSTSWAAEKLFQLLNYRYNARLATVITTNNLGLEGIAPRLRSRLSDRRLVRTVTMEQAQDFREMVCEE